jgi:MFS family permease
MVAAITSVHIHRRSSATLLAACGSMLAIAMSITASGVALGQVDVGSSIGIMHLQWVMNGFILSFAASLLPFGSVVDRLGSRWVFLSGCIIFSLATIVSICAGSFPVLMLGRLLQGVGAAQLAAAGPAALTALLADDSERKRAFGYLGASGGIGLTLGAFLSGAVSSWGGWQAAFALHLPFVVGAFVFALSGFQDRRDVSAHRFDFAGTVLSIVCIGAAMTFGISGSSLGWSSPVVLGALALACASGGAFVAVERRHPAPLMRFSILRNRQFMLACAVCVLFTTVWVALFIYVPLNLSAGQGRSGLDVGATMSALMVPALIMPLVASRWVLRVRIDIVLACGFVLMGAGLLLLFTGWSNDQHRIYEIAGLIVCGAGAGTLYGLADYHALTAVSERQAGLASGTFNLVRLAGDALGSIVPAAVLLDTLREVLARYEFATLPRDVMNELAAGRFAAVDSLALDQPLAELVQIAALGGFKEGMSRVVVALAVFTVIGVLLLVVPLLRTRIRN